MKRLHQWSDGIYRDRPEPGVFRARGMALTPLDADGRPRREATIHMRGPVFVHFSPDDEAAG